MLNLEHLHDLMEHHREAFQARVKEFDLGGRLFAFNTCKAIMGVVNLSTGSWYRESVSLSTEAALDRARVLRHQGAVLVDVGAESTLAHTELVNDTAQNSKLLPVIAALRREDILVSVETYHAGVARACLEAGACVLNLTGTVDTPELYRLVAAHEAGVIICFVQGANVRQVGDFNLQEDPMPLMYEYFARQIEIATAQGVSRILIDPGLGFYYRNLQDSAVRVRHQMKTFLHTFRLRTLGFPICHALPHAFEYFRDEVRCAEPFFAVLAALGNTDMFRTHEVSRVRAVLETLEVY